MAIPNSDEFPDIQLHGLLDLRYLNVDGANTWLDGGLSKFSYGHGGGTNLLNFNQAALVLQSRLDWSWSGILTAKSSERQNNPIDISEAILLFRPVSTSPWRFSGRIGAFFPPVSIENTGMAWTSPYTLTSSAINSWVGEELKVFGGEGQLSYQLAGGDKITVFGSGFANNDTAGVLLAWRGWSLDDYTATIGDSFAIPTETGLLELFPKQSPVTRPFVEVDGRPGFYAGLSVERPEFVKFRALYYDNRGNPSIVKNGQYAWHTRFGSLGLKMDLAWETEFIAQSMLGETQMGNEIRNLFAVDTTFWAASALLSKKMGPHRFSIRYDYFGTSENDFLPQDSNIENGYAWTCNYNITLLEHHQINFEMSNIYSDRASRLKMGLASAQNQILWQVAYRLFF